MDFDTDLAPFFLTKSIKILPKNVPRTHQFFDRFLDGFFIHFSANLAPNLGPCWPLFRAKRGDPMELPPSFCCVGFFFGFFRAGPWGTPSDRAPKPMGYPSCARFSDPFGLGFQRFCRPFCKFCGSFLGFYFGAV